MWSTQRFHLAFRFFVLYEREVEGFGDALVGDVVVCWAYTAAGDDEVVILRHAPSSFDDVSFIVGNHFYALEVDAEIEAEFREPVGVGVLGLHSFIRSVFQHSVLSVESETIVMGCLTFPPSTSSPIIRHAAVCIMLFCFSAPF